MSNITIALDAGHGGSDPGAVYGGRQEKDDVLKLTMAVGNILQNAGINVVYTRTNDIYETPFKKATDANNFGADYFVSIHRNSSERNNQYSGVETLVYKDSGIRSEMANNINKQLEQVGFTNLGVTERPNLVVLKRTNMPAVLVEVGFINTDSDNALFDKEFSNIAQGIADGILQTIYATDTKTTEVDESENQNNYFPTSESNTSDMSNNYDTMSDDMNNSMNNPMNNSTDNNLMNNSPNNMSNTDRLGLNDMNTNYQVDEFERIQIPSNNCNCTCDNNMEKLYRVQVGAYNNKENADRTLNSLLVEGFPAFLLYEDGYYKVQVGAYEFLTNAIKMEQRLRRFRYNTYIVYA